MAYYGPNGEFPAAVCAAAFAIHKSEEAEEYRRKMREDFENSKIEIKTTKEDSAGGSSRVTGRSSRMERKDTGDTETRKHTEISPSTQETRLPSRKPSRLSSMRHQNTEDQLQRRGSTRHGVAESKADSWEKAQLRKINKRYDKMGTEILAWENAKKMQAKLRMEKKKSELEMRRERNVKHYQNKVARIDIIAGGARTQLEERRRNEEAEIKEKARHIRSRGKSPVSCFCC